MVQKSGQPVDMVFYQNFLLFTGFYTSWPWDFWTISIVDEQKVTALRLSWSSWDCSPLDPLGNGAGSSGISWRFKKAEGERYGEANLKIWGYLETILKDFPTRNTQRVMGQRFPLVSVLSLCCMCGLFLLWTICMRQTWSVQYTYIHDSLFVVIYIYNHLYILFLPNHPSLSSAYPDYTTIH